VKRDASLTMQAFKSASRKQGFVEGPLHSHFPERRFWIVSALPTHQNSSRAACGELLATARSA
jgi:hypothetical protein